jgi:AcrR family transcriptional regulator
VKTGKAAKRHYDASRRRAQARETRRQIAGAARRLFFERGYAGATIEAIAEEAGVAAETVYATFRNKRNILAFVLDVAVGGDDAPLRILERPEPQAVLHDTDQRRQVAAFALGITEVLDRAAPVLEVTRIAAKTEPEIARRLTQLYAERLENMRLVARGIAANGPLRERLDEKEAAEIIWAVTSPELYQLVTQHLGWSKERYGRWLEEMLLRLLLP